MITPIANYQPLPRGNIVDPVDACHPRQVGVTFNRYIPIKISNFYGKSPNSSKSYINPWSTQLPILLPTAYPRSTNMSGLAITLLSALRMTVGVVGFLGPSQTAQLLGHPAPTSSIISNRLWASRDAVLGALLYSASSDESIRGALLAGMATDTLDIVAVALGLLNGSIGMGVATALGGGGLAFFGLGLFSLLRLNIKD